MIVGKFKSLPNRLYLVGFNKMVNHTGDKKYPDLIIFGLQWGILGNKLLFDPVMLFK